MGEVQDLGCPLPGHRDGYAPEDKADYSKGAWMAPPPGASGKRSVCDGCVDKIENEELDGYSYDPETGEVSQTS